VFSSVRIKSSRTAVRIVGVFSGVSRLPRGLSSINSSLDGRLAEAMKTPGFDGELGQTVAVGDEAVLVGLGEQSSFDAAAARTLGGRLVKALDRMNHTAVRLELETSVPAKTLDDETLGSAVVEGIVLANWRVDFFDGSSTTRSKARGALSIAASNAAVRASMERGLVVAESANIARRCAATPPNICNPAWIATQARSIARGLGLQVSVINATKAKSLGMGGLLNVGRGSATPPRLVVIEHRPERIKSGACLVLVGKTITYDTGGYSLKINGTMKGMKYDKCGGTTVLGAIRAIAALKLPVHVYALLPAAENMINGEAYRPDDIITMHNGTTVEVTNTDAEGRLVLADALSYACSTLKPTAIIDVATLTGGVVVALGHFCAGMWCEDDELRSRVEASAKTTGEKVWHLPLWEAHRDFMRAKHADLWNSAPSRNAHPIQGAAFLSFFVDGDVPWCHLDIAGVSDVERPMDLAEVGPTGYGVRLLTDIAESYCR